MEEIMARFVLLVSGLFVIVDPVGSIPLMLGLTNEHSPGAKRAVILRACLFAGEVLLFLTARATRKLRPQRPLCVFQYSLEICQIFAIRSFHHEMHQRRENS